MSSAQKKNKKAVLLLSGGMDSLLAGFVMKKLGWELYGFTVIFGFMNNTKNDMPSVDHDNTNNLFAVGNKELTGTENIAALLEIPLKRCIIHREIIQLIKQPRYGFGAGVNPCKDCKVMMLQHAAEYMKTIDASYLVTGEVIGQRPNSQRSSQIALIERSAELSGMIIRPLSGALLPPTCAEKDGLIHRNDLLDINGRQRNRQIEALKHFGITDEPYHPPGGGCLLADKGFSFRVRDMLHYTPDAHEDDFRLLRFGRHFRSPGGVKIIVGRNEYENNVLEYFKSGRFWLEATDVFGPVVLLDQPCTNDDINLAAELTSHYCKTKGAPNTGITLHMSDIEKNIIVQQTRDSFIDLSVEHLQKNRFKNNNATV